MACKIIWEVETGGGAIIMGADIQVGTGIMMGTDQHVHGNWNGRNIVATVAKNFS